MYCTKSSSADHSWKSSFTAISSRLISCSKIFRDLFSSFFFQIIEFLLVEICSLSFLQLPLQTLDFPRESTLFEYQYPTKAAWLQRALAVLVRLSRGYMLYNNTWAIAGGHIGCFLRRASLFFNRVSITSLTFFHEYYRFNRCITCSERPYTAIWIKHMPENRVLYKTKRPSQ